MNFSWLCRSWKLQRKLNKIAILRIWELVSFWGVKTQFAKLPLAMMYFQPWKKPPILCVSSWSKLDLNIFSTSKWRSGPQFCERSSCCSWQKNYRKWSKISRLFLPKLKKNKKIKNLHVLASFCFEFCQ